MTTITDDFGCLWCGRNLVDPDDLFCGKPCQQSWLSSDES